MTEIVTIYGFGSAFSYSSSVADIDLVIIHRDASLESCMFAIECRLKIIAAIKSAHVSILSENEERHFSFLKVTNAVRLGEIFKERIVVDVDAIKGLILTLLRDNHKAEDINRLF